MAYAILRVQKLKTMGDIGGSISHNYRTRYTPNADPSKTVNNEHDLQTAAEALEAIKGRIPEKHRKDAVLCVEHLITASPEWAGWG
ncbi:plasmid recombination protein, partial [Acinetobacter baumannii]